MDDNLEGKVRQDRGSNGRLSHGESPLPGGPNGDLEVDLSHELRTSLAILTLVSGNLDRLYDGLDDGQRRKMIQDIRRQTCRLTAFLDEVLALFYETDSLPM